MVIMVIAFLIAVTKSVLAAPCINTQQLANDCPRSPVITEPIQGWRVDGNTVPFRWRLTDTRSSPGWENLILKRTGRFLNRVNLSNRDQGSGNGCLQSCGLYCCEAGVTAWFFMPDNGNVWYMEVQGCDGQGRCGPWSSASWFVNGPSGPPTGQIQLLEPSPGFVSLNGSFRCGLLIHSEHKVMRFKWHATLIS